MTRAPGFRLIGEAPAPGAGEVALVVLEDAGGRLLLQLRDDRPEVAGGGQWGLFGGGVEAGEDLIGAALRELAEETGLAVPATMLRRFALVRGSAPEFKWLYAFSCRVPVAPAEIVLREGAGFAFMTPDQVRAAPLMPALKPLLDAYLVGLG